MKIITIFRKQDLLKHRPAIEELFFNCFGQREIDKVWDWAYLDNPNGDPIVSLCYEEDRLVGHYAIVPMPLSTDQTQKKSYISMTTMVAESHRKFGLFTQLAQENYRNAESAGVDFVFGFPNSQSTPGFRNRLNWTLPDSDYVATVGKPTLLKMAKKGDLNRSNLLSLNLTNPTIREWRLSRPGAIYSFENGLALKRYQNAVDLLWWESPEAIEMLPDLVSVNLLVSANSGLDAEKQFDYQFGGIGLKSSFDAKAIHRVMAISDLF